jgi:WD40 repeat protein
MGENSSGVNPDEPQSQPIRARAAGRGDKINQWVRQNPIRAAYALIAVFVLVTMVGVLFVAERSRRQAVERWRSYEEREPPLRQKVLALETQGRRTRDYVSDMTQAALACEQNHASKARELLERQIPEADSEDLRGFEWYFLTNLTDAVSPRHPQVLKGHADCVESVVFGPDSSRLASASLDGTIALWDVSREQPIRTWRAHSEGCWSVAFSPNGSTLATAGHDGSAKIWSVSDGQLVRTLKGHSDRVSCVCFSPDGLQLATAGGDRAVKMWDLSSGQEKLCMRDGRSWLHAVAYSPDGKWLASAGDIIRLWDASNGKEVCNFKTGENAVVGLAFSPDCKLLASASWDRSVSLLDLERCVMSRSFAHKDWVRSVAFSPDGKRLASAGQDSLVKLWDPLYNREPALVIKGHSRGVLSVAFSPDGRRLASAGEDGTVRIYDGGPIDRHSRR